MLRRGADDRELVDDVEEHARLHRQHHLGDLPHRDPRGLCYTAGITGAPGQGDDGRRHHPGCQLHRPLHSARATDRNRE